MKNKALIIFGILTLVLAFLKPPFWDEAHAWTIAKSFNLIELFTIEKFDGHLFLWHTIQMPFAKNNFFYPYSLYILNWIFCITGLIFFWNKAPFSDKEKLLITFSYPFFWYYAQVARCYSLGIMLLFIILSFWKERLNRPVLISFLLICAANTSGMAITAAFPLGLIFIYDLIKSKQKNPLPYLILMSGALLVYMQLFGAKLPFESTQSRRFISIVIGWFFLFINITQERFYALNKIFAISSFVLLYCSVFYFFKNKKALFYLIISYFLLTCIFQYKYTASWWNYLFYYINFLISIWLYRNNFEIKKDRVFNIFFMIFLIICCIKTLFFPFDCDKVVYKSEAREIASIIKQNEFFKPNDKIFAYDNFTETSVGILPFFPDVTIYDPFGNVKYSVEGFKNYQFMKFPIDGLYNSLDNQKRNILISDFTKPDKVLKGDKHLIKLKQIYSSKKPRFNIYEMIKN